MERIHLESAQHGIAKFDQITNADRPRRVPMAASESRLQPIFNPHAHL
jgi:hypothetical protein